MSSLKVLSIVFLFAADVRTGTLQKDTSSPRRCHHCVHNVTSNCETQTAVSVLCPVGQPFCATIARAPNFTSLLTCAAARVSPCLLTYNSKLELEMSCICTEQLCNVPYSTQLRNELLNFSAEIPVNTTELTEKFLNSTVFANVTKMELYKIITGLDEATQSSRALLSQSTTIMSIETTHVSEIAPRAEALKHEATVPPDDEDEGEGSGAFEEIRTQAAPAAPSSYLPSEESKAACTVLNLYLFVSLLIYLHA